MTTVPRPLHIAVDKGQLAVVKALLALGADVNAKDTGSDTVLMYAVSRATPRWSRSLLEQGADPNIPGNGGSTALMEAIKTGHGSMVPILLEHKADPALKDAQGRTAADLATQARRRPRLPRRSRSAEDRLGRPTG